MGLKGFEPPIPISNTDLPIGCKLGISINLVCFFVYKLLLHAFSFAYHQHKLQVHITVF